MSAIQLPAEPRRILIIKPSALGDIVHSLPVLNLLRIQWPSAHIAWLVTPAFAGLLEGHPQLDQVIQFDRKRFAAGWWHLGAAAGFFRFVRSLRQEKFDLVIDLQGLFRSGWLAGITGARARVGFADARELAWLFYNHRIKVPAADEHAVDRNLAIAGALGCGSSPVVFGFAPSQKLPQPIAPPYAVLLPGTNWDTKRWPIESFAQLVKSLRERFGLHSVVAGAGDSVELARRMRELIGREELTDLTGKTSLGELVSLLADAAVVIANDSGPMHIASALRRPMVALYGPTNPLKTGPYQRLDSVLRLDIVCSPCYSRHCSHQSCLRWLEPARVIEMIEELLEKKEAPQVHAGLRAY